MIPDVSMIPTPNEDPLGLGLDYGEMEEGEIDDVPETDAVRETGVQLEGASELKGIFFCIMLLLPYEGPSTLAFFRAFFLCTKKLVPYQL